MRACKRACVRAHVQTRVRDNVRLLLNWWRQADREQATGRGTYHHQSITEKYIRGWPDEYLWAWWRQCNDS